VTAALLAGLLAGYGIAMPVGAIATYLVTLTARTSLRIGAAAALGVATADGLYALIAEAGGSALARTIHPILLPLRWTSAAVLLALAAHGIVAAVRRHRERHASAQPERGTPLRPRRAYLALWALTMMNPLTVIYFAALVLGTWGRSAPTLVDQATYVIAAFAASASWQLVLALGGTLLGRALTSDRGRLLTAAASSALIAFLAIRLLI
jgi:threonine/homoserine/homoserine lactone efflux protein